jgi:hypothetical protein
MYLLRNTNFILTIGERPMKDKEDSTTIDWHDLTPEKQRELETLLEEWLDREEQEQEEQDA